MEQSNKKPSNEKPKLAVGQARPGRFYILMFSDDYCCYVGQCLSVRHELTTFGGEPNVLATASFEHKRSDMDDVTFNYKCLIECEKMISLIEASIGKYYRCGYSDKYLGKFLGHGFIYTKEHAERSPVIAFDRCAIVDDWNPVEKYLTECSEEK